MSIDSLVKKRRKVNFMLAFLLVILFLVLLFSVKNALMNYINFVTVNSKPSQISIEQIPTNTTIKLSHDLAKDEWQLNSPYQQRGSKTVINALLGQLNTRCKGNYPTTEINSEIFAKIQIDDNYYAIGEKNPVNNKVYVKQQNANNERWMFCDESVAAIALTPALNFIDRQLYPGEIYSIRGGFGQISIDNPLDSTLDVLDIAQINPNTIDKVIDRIVIDGDQGEKTYQVMLNSDGKHLLLFDDSTTEAPQIVYAIKSTPKLLQIIGL